MTNPKDLKYTKEHEWVRIKGKVAYVGITDHAQDELGDIVYVEMPEVGRVVVQGEETSNIESVKAAAPVYAPVSGTITEVNTALDPSPELINKSPYESHLFCIEMSDPSEVDTLMSSTEYTEMLSDDVEE